MRLHQAWESLLVLFLCAVGSLTTGCLQGSEYRRPAVDTPADWSRMAQGSPMASDGSLEPEAQWWRAFRNEELTGFIEQALASNHDVRRAVSRLVEGRASVTTAGAGLYPQINVQGSYTNISISKNTLAGLGLATGKQPGPQTFAAPGSGFDLWNGAADLRWELDVWGRIRRGMEAAEADAHAIEQDARAIALTLIGDVGQAYFRVRELDEQLDIAQRTLTLRRESLDIITKRASVGLASDLDVKRTEVLVAESAGQVPELTRLRTIELHRLEVLTGSAPGALTLEPKPLRQLIVQPIIPIGLPSQLLERRPDILQAEATLIAANARIGQARAYFFPSLSITGQGGCRARNSPTGLPATAPTTASAHPSPCRFSSAGRTWLDWMLPNRTINRCWSPISRPSCSRFVKWRICWCRSISGATNSPANANRLPQQRQPGPWPTSATARAWSITSMSWTRNVRPWPPKPNSSRPSEPD